MKNIKGQSSLTVRKRRKIDTTPFDRHRIPPKQNFFLTPVIWLLCRLLTLGTGLKINKKDMKGLKPPFLVLGSHHAFMDFYVTPLALFPHRANYISELEGFEYFGEWIYRQVGCLGTRKFVNDMALIKNIKKVLERKGILVIYPEARYANVGTSTDIPLSVSKLIKNVNVPVVTINMHGNYLQSPIWNLKKRKETRLSADICQLITKEETASLSLDEIHKRVSEYLTYDEYKWQYDNKMAITDDFRAEGLHKVLYRCPHCDTEFSVTSKGAEIICENCHSRYYMTGYGRMLKNESEFELSHIPDWYEWQRKKVEEEIDSGNYSLDCTVEIHALPNAKNFIDCGEGRLVHDDNGFALTFTDYGADKEQTMTFPPLSMLSVHTEYDYRGKGQCITLSTLDNTYFLFPKSDGFNATKIQFATEYLYKKAQSELKN